MNESKSTIQRVFYSQRAFFGAALLILAFNLVLSYVEIKQHSFIQDDAFIAFRYARNLVNGRGIVYNPGEYVEGYTDFLWVLIMSFCIKAGANPVTASKIVGQFSYLAMIVVVHLLVFSFLRAFKAKLKITDAIPMLVLLLLPLNPSSAAYATGGLETSLFGFLVVLSLYLTWFTRERGVFWNIASNLSFLLLCLTRPDGLLFFGIANLFLFLETIHRRGMSRNAIWELIKWNLPFAVLFSVYLIWKLTYYGAIFPNTFYTKSAYDPYLQRGLVYLESFYKGYKFAAAAWAIGILTLLYVPLHFIFQRMGASTRQLRAKIIIFRLCPIALMLFAFNFYVAWVGGDFMEYKPIMHIYPLTIAFIAAGIAVLEAQSKYLVVVTPLLVAGLICLGFHSKVEYPDRVLDITALNNQIDGAHDWDRAGRILRKKLPKDTIIATTAAGAIPFYSRLMVIDMLGLSDSAIGHSEIKKRSVVGHEKYAQRPYLIERGVNLVIGHPEKLTIEQIPQSPFSGPEIFINLDNGLFLRAEYLVRKSILTEYFKSNPRDFVLRNIY